MTTITWVEGLYSYHWPDNYYSLEAIIIHFEHAQFLLNGLGQLSEAVGCLLYLLCIPIFQISQVVLVWCVDTRSSGGYKIVWSEQIIL